MNDEVQAPAQTLEDWGAQIAQEQGHNPASPAVQTQIRNTAAQIRQQVPNTPDEQIIQRLGPVIKQSLEQAKAQTAQAPAAVPQAPAAPVAATPAAPTAQAPQQSQFMNNYNAAFQKLSAEYSPEKEAAVRAQVANKNKWQDLGQNLATNARIKAGPEYAKMLADEDKRARAANNAPLEDWQAKKQAALDQLKGLAEAGKVNREDVQAQLSQLALDQGRLEAKDKNALAEAENDAASFTSEMYQSLLKQYNPQLAEQLGPKLKQMTGAQIKKNLPLLEKQYEKILADNNAKAALADKEENRKFLQSEGDKNRQNRLDVANAKKKGAGGGSGGTKPPTVSNLLAIQKEANKIDDKQGTLDHTEELLNEAEKLFSAPNKPTSGPITGFLTSMPGGRAVGGALGGPQRQRLQQITDELTVQVQALQKGSASDSDSRRYEAVVDMLSKDDPMPGIKAAKEAIKNDKGRLAAQRQALSKLAGEDVQTPAAAPAGGSTVRMKDKAGNSYDIPANQVQAALKDGLTKGP